MNYAARDRLQFAAQRSHALGYMGVMDLMRERFLDLALERPYTASTNGWTDTGDIDSIETLLSGFEVNRARRGQQNSWYGVGGDNGVFVDYHGDGDWCCWATGMERSAVDALLARFDAALPGAESVEGTIPVTFHCLGPMGPISYTRRLAAGGWETMAQNYPAAVHDRLCTLMAMEPPQTGGRLVLFHGPPGTGKTHTVRALAQAWKEWADTDYVVDSDAFFEYAHYMVSTMVMGGGYGDESRWRLVVLEDSGEFLTKEAGQRPGGGLGRLLNLADGLVGQGLNLIVLMSTNEPIESLHPALTRPGRCMASILFPEFDAADANVWLDQRGVRDVRVDQPTTLAELYQLATRV